MVKELDESTFNGTIQKGITVVDFWAPWCGPCKMMAPVFEDLSKQYTNMTFAKLNVDEHSSLSGQFNVLSIPTLIVFKDGKEINRLVGFMQKNELAGELSKIR